MIAVVAIISVAAAASVLGTASGATSYTVGEPGGSWDLQTNLTAWASTVDFHPGDQLMFKYDASAHDVVEVTQAGYSSCSIGGERAPSPAAPTRPATTAAATPFVSNVPLGGAAPGSSAAGLGSLLVTVVSLLFGLTLTIA